MLHTVYRKDDSALGQIGIDSLNLDHSKTGIEGQGQDGADPSNRMHVLQDDLVQDKGQSILADEQEGGLDNDFTIEEQAKLMKALNLIN